MSVRIHFAGLVPGRPLVMLAWAAYARDAAVAGATEVHFGRELADAFATHWRIASRIDDCDVVVYPHSYEDGADADRVAEAARTAGKPCLFYSQDERLPPSRLRYGTLYRSSIFKKLPYERAHPVFINDVRQEVAASVVAPLAKNPCPSIGFCGFVGTPLSRLAWRMLGARQKVDGLAFRARVLDQLRGDNRLDCRFVARGSYLGHATYAAFDKQHPLTDARAAFLENLFDCPYNLALRGKGNHSVRFYEILAAGRIPLFVNTGCVLPLENEIDWKSHCVWAEDFDLARIGDRVAEFHAGINDDDFIALQHRNRVLWEDRLRPEPYFRHVLERVAAGHSAP
jgi:hypothetical protein